MTYARVDGHFVCCSVRACYCHMKKRMGEKCLFHTAAQTDIQTNSQPGRQANRVRLSLFRAFSLKRNTSQKNLLFTAREHSFLVENLCLAGETLVSVLQGLCAKFEMYGWALQSQTLAGLRTFVLMLRNKCFSTRIVRL